MSTPHHSPSPTNPQCSAALGFTMAEPMVGLLAVLAALLIFITVPLPLIVVGPLALAVAAVPCTAIVIRARRAVAEGDEL